MESTYSPGYDVYLYDIMVNRMIYTIRTPFPAPDGCAGISGALPNIGGEAVSSCPRPG